VSAAAVGDSAKDGLPRLRSVTREERGLSSTRGVENAVLHVAVCNNRKRSQTDIHARLAMGMMVAVKSCSPFMYPHRPPIFPVAFDCNGFIL